MRTLPNSWRDSLATALAALAFIGLAAACGSSNQASQEETSTQSAQSPEEQFNAFFDANYADLTVKDLQDNNFEPEDGCVTKGSITLADSQKQAQLQNMTGDMGVHRKAREGTVSSRIQSERALENGATVDVEPITADTDPSSSVIGIEETVAAKDWDEEHPGETPSDFGTGFTLFQSMGGMEEMGEMGNMEGTEGGAEYALHGYRDNNANGTFAPVDSTISCS